MAGECDSARAAAVRLSSGNAGCSALTRRCAVLLHGGVNRGPAQCCVWPVLAPAKRWRARGLFCAAMRVSRGVLRSSCARFIA